ncbi:hypothetical protein [Cohnella thailandensis]|uniref:Uncharacterized protein n=1 Tax=Cohnella thailandensis TaxID=557557 RepID=A0A841SVR1_9BACL|nr:hypothetical protein [Cohnella thailandensis]MBB6632791.1 hypothetical protein [Cohnella thailandensis]MBP1975518.1 hypothetical protein [Cohnella thailandensis]
MNQPWRQEPMWVQRNEAGIIIAVQDKPPKWTELAQEWKRPNHGVGAVKGQRKAK